MTQARWGVLALGCATIVVVVAACQNPLSSGSSNTSLPPYLYVANYGSSSGANGICAFSIGTGGGLSPISLTSSTTGANPSGMAIGPNGIHLYVANLGYVPSSGSGTPGISAFSIGTGGSLSPLTLTKSGSTTGAHPAGIAITPNGDYLYVANSGYVPNSGSTGTAGISAFSIGTRGALSPLTLTGSGSTTGANPAGIAISRTGDYLYVLNNGTTGANGLSAFSIGTGGSLSPLTLTSAGSTTGPHPLGIAISPNGKYLYVTNYGSSNGTNGISAFSIASDGTLSALTLSSSGSTTGASPEGIAISPNSNYLYVTNGANTGGANGISAFSIASDGTLSALTLSSSGSTTGANPAGIAISSDGAYLYVTNELTSTGANGISAFSVGSGGLLSPISLTSEGSTTGPSPLGIAIVD